MSMILKIIGQSLLGIPTHFPVGGDNPKVEGGCGGGGGVEFLQKEYTKQICI